MSTPLSVLIVEDSASDCTLMVRQLRKDGFEVQHQRVETAAQMRAALRETAWDAVVSDFKVPGFGASPALAMLRESGLDLPFILVSGTIGEEAAVALMKSGAHDYVPKDHLARLAPALTREIAEARGRLAYRKAQEELLQSEARYRALAQSAADAIVTGDPEGNIRGWNTAAERMFGYAEAEVLGRPLTLLIPQRYRDGHVGGMRRVLAGGERHVLGRTAELHGLTKAGAEFPLELSLSEWQTPEGRFFTGIIRDISERKAIEAKILRQNEFYAALSQTNEAIVRSKSEEELYSAICRIAVEFGGMKVAWIGLVVPDSPAIRCAACFGEGAEAYLQEAAITADAGSPRGRGPTGTAVRENRPVWLRDFQNDPRTAPWREQGARLGFGASAALPLHRNRTVAGALTLYTAEANAFDRAARDLILKLAANISFALDNFAREAAREQAENQLRAAEAQFRGLIEQSLTGIYITRDGVFTYANPRLGQVLDYGPGELVGVRTDDIIVAEDLPIMQAERAKLRAGASSTAYEVRVRRRDGSVIELGVTGSIFNSGGEPSTIGMAQDITEKKRAEEEIRSYMHQLEAAFLSTVEVATSLSEMRDPYTAGHERQVAEIAAAIGAALGFDARRQEGLRVAGHLHDVGKITIPSEILSKPGKISTIEFKLIQCHAQAGYDVLKGVEFPWPVAQVALQHHERMDGSGYPQGLKGDAILLEARIMAVADVVEAMSSHRPYRAGLGIDSALAEIERGRGTVYDPAVADACLKIFREDHFAFQHT